MTSDTALPPVIGVSSCLLGENVRYKAVLKRNPYIADVLNRFFRYIPVCPEVGCGLPVPREAMRLEGDPAAPRLMTIRNRLDMTESMLKFCTATVRELEREELCGFIFKTRSPSCEPYRIDVFHDGLPTVHSSGLFAAAIVKHFPGLPVEEEERLQDPAIREAFIQRVTEYRAERTNLTEISRKG
jgi:uncharacterized protein YbbK (DUF523 family)